jgi:hypothetical protein
MKKLKIIGFLLGTLAVGMIAGYCIAAVWLGRAWARMEFAKPEIEQAFLAAQEAHWAALLRLNEPGKATEDLENSIHIRLVTIANWELVAPADERTRKARDRFLTPVKIYSQSYPITGSDTTRINGLLATVPGRNPTSECKSAVCRLDDLRQSKAGAATNSP